MDFAGRIIAVLVCVVLLVLFPLQYIAQVNGEAIDDQVDDNTQALSDSIRDKGYLDASMYEKYMDFLDHTGELYDIEIEDIHPVTGDDIYSANTSDSTSEAENLSYTDSGKILGDISKTATIKAVQMPDNRNLMKSFSISGASVSAISSSDKSVTQGMPLGTMHVCNGTNCTYNTPEVFVAYGGGGLYYSYDSKTWKMSPAYLGGTTIYGGTYGNGQYVIVGNPGAGCTFYSTDGNSWRAMTGLNYSNTYYGVTYGNSRFICVGSGASYYSTNGTSWTAMSGDVPSGARKITYGNGRFITTSGSKIFCSANGTSWQSTFDFFNQVGWSYVPVGTIYAAGKFYCYGYTNASGYTREFITSSNDGVNWVLDCDNIPAYFYSMTYANGKFIAVSSTNYIFTSTDGKNWTQGSQITTTGATIYDIYYSNGKYVCSGGNNGTNLQVWSSSDCNTWQQITVNSTSGIALQGTCSNASGIVCTKKGKYCMNVAATYSDGTAGTVEAVISTFDYNTPGTYTVTLSYTELINGITLNQKTCMIRVTVRSLKTLSSLSVTPASQIINRYGTPSFTVKAGYSDGSNATLTKSQYTMTALDTSVTGAHTITFSYTENGITKTANATVYVDALVSITVSPETLTVDRYTSNANLPLTVTASYLYHGIKTITAGYAVNGYVPNIIGIQNITVSYTENGITKSAAAKVIVTVLHKTCPRCLNTYDMNPDDTDPGCPYCKQLITAISVTPDSVEVTQGNSLPITVSAAYNDGSSSVISGWISNYNANKTGLQTVTIEYGGYAAEISVWVKETMITCPICHNDYPVSLGKCPICAETVTSISVSPGTLTVYQYDGIVLTVTAFYADGHSETVTEWSIDKDTSDAGTYTATVTYQDVSTTISLIVVSKTAIICPICGLSYEPVDNPRGCPACSTYLIKLEAYPASGSNLVQYGTEPDIDVILIFRDAHQEMITVGYTLENYDAYKLGAQIVTVHYKGLSTNLDIEVVNSLTSVTCPQGHVYYLNEDGSDPGCPYCSIEQTEGTVCYFDISYEDEIIDKVYQEGIYYFASGDFISVHVVKRNRSLLVKLQKMFFKTVLLGRKEDFIYGGEVF